jgi:hypothetical protein
MATQLQQSAQNNTVEVDRERERKEELNRMANEADSVGFDTGKGFLHLQRVGLMFSKSKMVPRQYQDNINDCCIAVNLARRLKADELMVMQNLYVVYGRPGWSSKFKIAMFNQTGKFTPISYQFVGEKGKDSYGCRAVCANRETGEQILGPEVTIAIAKAEGWYDRKKRDSNESASKWPTMPELMLRYRAAAWMIDTTAPELTMGIGTVEEHIDTGELLNDIIEETDRRRANNAFANSPSNNVTEMPSKSIVDAAAPPDPPKVPEEKPKQSAPKKTDAPAPTYSEQEPDPWAPGGDLYGK